MSVPYVCGPLPHPGYVWPIHFACIQHAFLMTPRLHPVERVAANSRWLPDSLTGLKELTPSPAPSCLWSITSWS